MQRKIRTKARHDCPLPRRDAAKAGTATKKATAARDCPPLADPRLPDDMMIKIRRKIESETAVLLRGGGISLRRIDLPLPGMPMVIITVAAHPIAFVRRRKQPKVRMA